MSFFISDAMAAASPVANPSFTGLIPFAVIFVIFYFLLIRPQQKRAKEHTNMIANLTKGDEVVTAGGLLAKVVKVGENFIHIEINANSTVLVQKSQISQIMPKGTLKLAQ